MPTNARYEQLPQTFTQSNSALDGTGDVIPRNNNDAAKSPQIHEKYPKVGLEGGGVLVANTDTDGGHGCLAAVIYEKRGEHILYSSTCVATRDADEELEGICDHGDGHWG